MYESEIATTVNHLFNWWSIICWLVAFVLIIMLCTPLWKYVWRASLLFAFIGFLCYSYAGITANWYVGWFGWTPFLGAFLFIRVMLHRLDNLLDKENQ